MTGNALAICKEKLERFLEERAISAGGGAKFELEKRIEETRREIEELEKERLTLTSDPRHSAKLERIQSTFPSVNSKLVGRESDLTKITTLLQASGHTIVCLKAIGGMGKTALAKQWCLEHLNDYEEIVGARLTDREFLIRTDGPQIQLARIRKEQNRLAWREYLENIGLQLGIAISGDDDVYEKEIVNQLGSKRSLFVVDNVETDPNTSTLLASLLKMCRTPTRTALVTTRVLPTFFTNAVTSHPVNNLGEKSSRALVENWLSSKNSDLDTLEFEDAIEDIVAIAAGHPLALELLAGKLLIFGNEAIATLKNDWRADDRAALSDTALQVLCSFIFDDTFSTYLGKPGIELLKHIAMKRLGAEEHPLQRAFSQVYENFTEYLQKLFETGCIYRKIIEGRAVLLMHPLTRAYFNKKLP